MRRERPEGRRLEVIAAEPGDAAETVLEALEAARGDPGIERIVLDLRGAEGLGLLLTPGTMLPPLLWEQVQEQFGVDPAEAPVDPALTLVLDPEGLRSAGYLGLSDYWRLAATLDEALGG